MEHLWRFGPCLPRKVRSKISAHHSSLLLGGFVFGSACGAGTGEIFAGGGDALAILLGYVLMQFVGSKPLHIHSWNCIPDLGAGLVVLLFRVFGWDVEAVRFGILPRFILMAETMLTVLGSCW